MSSTSPLPSTAPVPTSPPSPSAPPPSPTTSLPPSTAPAPIPAANATGSPPSPDSASPPQLPNSHPSPKSPAERSPPATERRSPLSNGRDHSTPTSIMKVPPHSPPQSSFFSPSTSLFVGVAVAAALVLLFFSIICLCCRKKKRRPSPPEYYGGVPPPKKDGYYGDPYGGHPQDWQYNVPPPADGKQNWQQNAEYNVPPPADRKQNSLQNAPAPPPDHVIRIPLHDPSPPPPFASRPPHSSSSFASSPPRPPPPPPPISTSAGSESNFSSSESPLPPPPPGPVLGFSKSTFTYEELTIATDGFSDANLLGQGGFGKVHKGVLPNGKEVAIKQLKTGGGQGEREFRAEIEIISRVHHKHLVSLVGYCISGGQRLLVYEYVPNKTLELHLHGKDRPTMDWPTRLKIALGSAKGLAYLHEDCHPKIIHRDIKSANILLDHRFEAKVADFGLAKFTSDEGTHVSTRVIGTFGYLAPEYASSGKLTEKSDVFSFGIMLLEMITGKRPVDPTYSFMDDSFVDWARPLLTHALEEGLYDGLVDPRLGKQYNLNEMVRMIACAAACIRHSARHRPRMSQVVRALDGDVSLADLSEAVRPGQSDFYGSYDSSDYGSGKYNEVMKKIRKMASASQEYPVTGYSEATSEYGQKLSDSSSDDEERHELRAAKEMRGSRSIGLGSRFRQP